MKPRHARREASEIGRGRVRPRGLFLCLFAALFASHLVSADPHSGEVDLTSLSLEELMTIEVTSVSKKEEKLFEAPAAIFVITNEDIRRSGVTTIPEALRMAPGIEVARIDGNKWAITSRGFNFRFANKLLVLIDGRSVYTPLFSGIFWEVQDVLLEDVDRIEVIRGPGAVLWGANAVNGIVNIITKSSSETQENLVNAGVGTEELAFASLRTGGKAGKAGHYRAYAKYFDRDALDLPTGEKAEDGSTALRVGFRTDWGLAENNELTIQGDLYDGEVGQTYTIIDSVVPPFSSTFGFDVGVSGANLLGRWTQTRSETSDFSLQLYYDRTKRDDAFGSETRDTFDLEFQRRRGRGRHDLVWGLGYRRSVGDLDGSLLVSAEPPRRADNLFNVFIQDEIAVRPNEVQLTIGAKLEHNDYTGYEFQPNLRFLWAPTEHHSLWASVSRAVRTPSRADHDIRFVLDALPPDTVFPGAPSALVVVLGNPDFESEELEALEVGYRFAWRRSFSLDLATFYNTYDSLSSVEQGPPFPEDTPPPPHLVLPLRPDNKMYGDTYGTELALEWQPIQRWRLQANYSTLWMDLRLDPDSTAVPAEPANVEGRSPRFHGYIRSSVDFPHGLDFDLMLRHVDELPSLGVDSYTAVDGRLGWRPRPDLELAVVGKNLTDSDHIEFVTPFLSTASTVARRSMYAAVTWRF